MAEEKADEPKGRRRKVEDAGDDSHSGVTDDQKAVDAEPRRQGRDPVQHTIEDQTPVQWSFED